MEIIRRSAECAQTHRPQKDRKNRKVGERKEKDKKETGAEREDSAGLKSEKLKRDGVCVFKPYLSFLQATNTCPVEGALPRRREAAGRGRAGVLHEKQPICKRVLAGDW